MKESNDILTLFESLNNHEVFTPPRLARDMLSTIPKEVWFDPNIRVLDPCVKSGVFLREAMYLLFEGLLGKGLHTGPDGVTYDLSNPKQLMRHILKNMLFGIATSELTGYLSRRTLYGVMEANTDKQTALIDSFQKSKNNRDWSEEEKVNFLIRNRFNDYYDHNMFNVPQYKGYEYEGNIFYPREEVQKKVVEDGNYEIEDTYYPFIEGDTLHAKIQHIRSGKMKFDVIIGNPPYQVSDGGGMGTSAIPIYQKFIENAIDMSPRFISMITPARWYSGGKGLDGFRAKMLSSKKIREIHDYIDATDIFPGVQIKGGVSYFLWDKKHDDDCKVVSHNRKSAISESIRPLKEEGLDVFVRFNEAISILRKIRAKEEPTIISNVSSRMPKINQKSVLSSYTETVMMATSVKTKLKKVMST
jgi:site-specific DNA-methyltransferase (adenine-specific)